MFQIVFKNLLQEVSHNANMRKAIVLWELREQKCQQHVYSHLDAVHPGQAGWMVLILQWKMVMSPGRSALVIVILVVKP